MAIYEKLRSKEKSERETNDSDPAAQQWLYKPEDIISLIVGRI